MAITNNFIPQVWSARLNRELETQYVMAQFANTNYEGDISGGGSSVRIGKLTSDITISDYTRNQDLANAQLLDDSSIVLPVDQQKAFHFYLDDVDKAQARPEIMTEAMRKAAISVARVVDGYVATRLSAGLLPANTMLTENSPGQTNGTDGYLADLINLRTMISRANIAADSQVSIVVPPEVVGAINRHFGGVNADRTNPGVPTTPTTSESATVNGVVARLFGINIVESNNVPTTRTGTGAAAKNYFRCFALTGDAITMARQISTIEAYRPDGRFGDAVKGLYTYGAVVSDPAQLFALDINTGIAGTA